MENMQSKTIVITGSTRGIGLGLATELLQTGHQLIINGKNPEHLNTALITLRKISQHVEGVCGSITIEHTHKQLFDKAIQTFGKVDIWINNAGVPQPNRLFVQISENDIKQSVETNIIGVMLGTKTAAGEMLKQGWGKIFNMEGFGSDGRIMNKMSLYGTTKRALHYFSKSVSAELKGTPVQLGILSPGMVRTDFLKKTTDPRTKDEAKQFDKVLRFLAEDPEKVTRFLSERLLQSTKQYDRIEFLTKKRLMVKLIRMMLHK